MIANPTEVKELEDFRKEISKSIWAWNTNSKKIERLRYGLDTADSKTSAGKEGDTVSTQHVLYKRINTFYATFSAEIDELHVFPASKDMYIPNKVDFINCNLILIFISWFINKTSPAISHVSKALMFLQRKLSDAMNALG
jgi:hypothetical protein